MQEKVTNTNPNFHFFFILFSYFLNTGKKKDEFIKLNKSCSIPIIYQIVDSE